VLLRFCFFTGHDVVAGAERKRRRSQSRLPYFPVTFAAARGDGAWRGRAATVHTGPEGFPALL